MSKVIGVVRFPGTNCEFDTIDALQILGAETKILWHGDRDIANVDSVIIPGGFAHGDYLRCGAIAQFSPGMDAVKSFAKDGGPVLGICNGFQVLTEAGLLPGALQKNVGMKFLCSMQTLEFVSTSNILGASALQGDSLRIPINHFEGNYVCEERVLKELEERNQIVFRYADNPNGSIADIAGISRWASRAIGLAKAISPLGYCSTRTSCEDLSVFITQKMASQESFDTS